MAGADILRGALIGADMTEDELLAGITEALGFGGWTWTHIIRSSGVTMGHAGLPDIIAVRGGIVLAWELKTARGTLTVDQMRWGVALGELTSLGGVSPLVDWRVIRPVDYDGALEVIIQGRHPIDVFG